jgi:hypothetical protein
MIHAARWLGGALFVVDDGKSRAATAGASFVVVSRPEGPLRREIGGRSPNWYPRQLGKIGANIFFELCSAATNLLFDS